MFQDFIEHKCSNTLTKIFVNKPFYVVTLQNGTYQMKKSQIDSKSCANSFKGIVSLLSWSDYYEKIQPKIQSSFTKMPFLLMGDIRSKSYIETSAMEHEQVFN